jgi:shikimate dehydrogenase
MLRPRTREVELNFRGFAVTNPHKRSVIRHLDHIDETAARIGAVNTIKVVDGSLRGFNTDADGFIRPLKARLGDLHGARAAILGAGGTAKACVYALKQEEAEATVFAREPSSADEMTAEFGIECRRLTINSDAYSAFDIVVNTTPLGTRGELESETIATAEQLHGVKLAYDVVYNPAETRFLREAGQAGADTLGGFDMLVTQAACQQQIWTGEWPAIDEMASAARNKLDEG